MAATLRYFYQRLIEAGKPKKVALTAVGRKAWLRPSRPGAGASLGEASVRSD